MSLETEAIDSWWIGHGIPSIDETIDDSGWDHPPPPGTVKVKCCRCTLWFSCRDGIEMCPICRTVPSITTRRYLQKRK